MKIQKFYHSCLVIEENNKRIMIDPGTLSFGEALAKVAGVPKIDAILITHKHPDHCFPQILKEFVARDGCAVYCNGEIGYHINEGGVQAKTITVPQSFEAAGITIQSTVGDHAPLPVPLPQNNGFLISNRLFHPGDCHTFEHATSTAPEILALPLMAPWGTITRALELAVTMKPKHVIPIHDGFVKTEFLMGMYSLTSRILSDAGIAFHPLKPGEVLEL